MGESLSSLGRQRQKVLYSSTRNEALGYRVRGGSSLPVVLHDVPGSFQLCSRQQQIPRVSHSEEVPGSAQESALVPTRFLDIDIQGQLTHFLQGKDGSRRTSRRVSKSSVCGNL